MKIKIAHYKSNESLGTTELVQRIKVSNSDPQSAYGLFVQARSLKPEISMKEFAQILNSVNPCSYVEIEEVEFCATHKDVITNTLVMISDPNDNGVRQIVFENGSYGFIPSLKFAPNALDRYEVLS